MNGNGFTRVYNEIADPLLKELSHAHFKVFYYIYRQLVGWNRDSAEIPITEIMQKTGVSIPMVISGCKLLEEKNIFRLEKLGKSKNSGIRFHFGDKLQDVIKSVNNQTDNIDKNTESCKMSLVPLLNELITSIIIYKDNKDNNYDHDLVDKLDKVVKLFNNEAQGVNKDSKDDHDHSFAQNSDLTIVTGAILEKWGKQLVQVPPQAQVMTALQELGKSKMLEAIQRAPLVLKEPDPMKIVNFIIKVAEHPSWYRKEADIATKQETAEEKLKKELDAAKDFYESVKNDKRADMTDSSYVKVLREAEEEFKRAQEEYNGARGDN